MNEKEKCPDSSHEIQAAIDNNGLEDIKSYPLDTINLLHQSVDVIEIRMPKANKYGQVYAGYYNDFDKADQDIQRYNGKVPAIYVNLNPVNPALLSRAANRIDENSKLTTQDSDIIKRIWFYVDIDPKRPTGISSTDKEHEEAIKKAYSIKEYLIKMGWGEPIICDSGNGASLLFKIDMENNAENTDLIKNCLIAFDYLYSDDKTEIDLTVFNAARIIKLYGTIAKKGDNTPERPHRVSKILEIPTEIKNVTIEQIKEIIKLIPKEPEEKQVNTNGFDIEEWLKVHGISWDNKRLWNSGTLYSLDVCPFDSNHKRPDSSIIKHKSGAISFQCFHNSCSNHNWQELRALKEPEYKTQKERAKEPQNIIEYEEEPLEEQTEDNQERRINLNLPGSHFISQYVKWGESVTDAYKEYHIFNAFWLLSAATNRKIVLKLRQEYIRPNLWIMALGNSSTSRKSTAVNKARKIYECATDKNLPNDDFSLEGYLESLQSEPIMHNVKDEASGLLAKYHQRYNDGIFDFECSVYDGSPEILQKRLASGKAKEPKKYTIKNYYVTKLYATTPDKLALCMSINDFMCGYGYRWIFNYPKYKHIRKPLEMETPEDVSSWLKVIGRIRDFNNLFIQSDEIEFKATPEVMKCYDGLCIEVENKAEEQNNDILNSIIGRSQVHILKIAMLLELGKDPVSTTLTEESIKTATEMITGYCIPSIMEVIERLQEDVKNNYIEKIISILRRLGGEATHTKLLRDSNMKSRDFIECIETMKESHRIKIVQDKPRLYKLINHENVLNFRKVRKVRNVREYIEGDNISTNITKIVSVDTHTPSTTLLRTNEPYEHYEQNEQKDKPVTEIVIPILKEKFDKINHSSHESIIVELMVLPELENIQDEVLDKIVSDYCKLRGWS